MSQLSKLNQLLQAAFADAREVPRQFPFQPSSFCMWGSVPDIAEFR